MVMVYFTHDMEPDQVMSGVRAIAQGVQVLGACSAGVIVPQGVFRHAVGVLALQSDEIQTHSGVVTDFSSDPTGAGRLLVDQVWSQADGAEQERNGLLLCLENTHNSEAMVDIVESVGDQVGAVFPLAGGRAVDPTHRLQECLFFDDNAHTDAISATLLLTSGTVGVGVRHGYQPLGRPLLVTRVEGNILHELDGKSAYETYMEQLGDQLEWTLDTYAKHAVNHPLGLPQMGREYIIRDPYAAGPNGSLYCAGSLPHHAVVRIMKGDQESLLASAHAAAVEAMSALEGQKPAAVFVFSCVTRLAYLGDAAAEELRIIQRVVGPAIPIFGLVTYGEIAAQQHSPPAFHNKAIVIGAISVG
jgi:hypothetical protein